MKQLALTPEQLKQVRRAFERMADVDSWHDSERDVDIDANSDDRITLYFDARYDVESVCTWQGDYLHPAEYANNIDAYVSFIEAVDDEGEPVEIVNIKEVECAALDGLYS